MSTTDTGVMPDLAKIMIKDCKYDVSDLSMFFHTPDCIPMLINIRMCLMHLVFVGCSWRRSASVNTATTIPMLSLKTGSVNHV